MLNSCRCRCETINLNLATKMAYSIEDQIKCVRREIAMRRRVFAKRVADDKMKPKDARYEIECMEAVLATLEKQDRLL
jgi:hypothetical protein